MILEIPHPEFGVVRQVASPIKISDSKVAHRPAPKLGEHTNQILMNYLKMSSQEIESLRQASVL